MERKSPSSMETILSRVVNESRSDKEGVGYINYQEVGEEQHGIQHGAVALISSSTLNK